MEQELEPSLSFAVSVSTPVLPCLQIKISLQVDSPVSLRSFLCVCVCVCGARMKLQKVFPRAVRKGNLFYLTHELNSQ